MSFDIFFVVWQMAYGHISNYHCVSQEQKKPHVNPDWPCCTERRIRHRLQLSLSPALTLDADRTHPKAQRLERAFAWLQQRWSIPVTSVSSGPAPLPPTTQWGSLWSTHFHTHTSKRGEAPCVRVHTTKAYKISACTLKIYEHANINRQIYMQNRYITCAVRWHPPTHTHTLWQGGQTGHSDPDTSLFSGVKSQGQGLLSNLSGPSDEHRDTDIHISTINPADQPTERGEREEG